MMIGRDASAAGGRLMVRPTAGRREHRSNGRARQRPASARSPRANPVATGFSVRAARRQADRAAPSQQTKPPATRRHQQHECKQEAAAPSGSAGLLGWKGAGDWAASGRGNAHRPRAIWSSSCVVEPRACDRVGAGGPRRDFPREAYPESRRSSLSIHSFSSALFVNKGVS